MHNSDLLFYEHIDQLRSSIPDTPTAIFEHTNHASTTLVASYLRHYQIDFFHTLLAQRYCIWQSRIGSFQIVQQHWQAVKPKATIIISHGYLDHTALYGQLIQWALKQHYSVLCFDLPGHGLSNGQSATIDHFDEYADTFAEVLKQAHQRNQNSNAILPIYTIGQSTGCSTIANYLLTQTSHTTALPVPDKIIFLAPLVRSRHWNMLRWVYFALKNTMDSIRRRFVDSSHNRTFNYFVKHYDPFQTQAIYLRWLGAMESWHQTINTLQAQYYCHSQLLIIQGTEDNTVDWRYNVPAMQRCFPNHTTCYIDGAGHHLANEIPQYWQGITESIHNYLA